MISAIPQKAVELIFDVPDGIAPEKVSIYQLFIDGTLAKRNNTTVTDDGKIKFNVYRLGDYVMGYSDILPNNNQLGDDSNLFGEDNNLFGDDSNLFGDDSNLFGDNNTQTDDNNTQAGDDNTQTGDKNTQTDDNSSQTNYYIYIVISVTKV